MRARCAQRARRGPDEVPERELARADAQLFDSHGDAAPLPAPDLWARGQAAVIGRDAGGGSFLHQGLTRPDMLQQRYHAIGRGVRLTTCPTPPSPIRSNFEYSDALISNRSATALV